MKWLEVVSRGMRGLRVRLVLVFLAADGDVAGDLILAGVGEWGGEVGSSGNGPFGGGRGRGGRAVMLRLSLEVMFW